MKAKKIIFSYSGGKDSIYALYKLLKNPDYEVVRLFSTLSKEYKRVSFHGFSEEILDAQARAMGLAIDKIFISKSDTIDEYAQKLESYLLESKNKGINLVAYGDIFLEDLKAFRIKSLAKVNMSPVFPIWGTGTKENILDFIDLGFKAVLTCIDTNVLDESFLGREIDEGFIADLPDNVDVCGENGEYHTFVYDSPIFKMPILFEKGEIKRRENYLYMEVRI